MFLGLADFLFIAASCDHVGRFYGGSMTVSYPIIALEGIDGAGKATQVVLLAKALTKLGHPVWSFGFPDYSTPIGVQITHLLKNQPEVKLPINSPVEERVDHERPFALTLQCLMTCNRYEHAESINQRSGHTLVLLDRYIMSSVVYGAISGCSTAVMHSISSSLPQADLNILIDIPVNASFKRRPSRRDKFESNEGFLERARWEYLKQFRHHSWPIIDGTAAEAEIHARIVQQVLPLLPEVRK